MPALLDPTETPKPDAISAPAAPAPATYRNFLDHDTTRQRVFDGVLDAVKTGFPIENARYRLELVDPSYEGPDKFTKADEKKAILSRGSLTRKLVGTWKLSDKNTGEILDERRQALANIPYLTSRGVYINNGSEYTVSNQMRLLSGVFTRQKESGEFEAHFNVLRGGPSFRVFMEPQTGVFRLQLGQSKIRLFPVLRSLGITDRQLMEKWGNEVFQANAGGRETGTEVKKVLAKLGTFGTKEEMGDEPPKSVSELFANLELDPRVTSRTLGKPHARVTPDVFLDTTSKLLGISRGEQEPDDRDSLAYQDTYSAEDLFKERFQRDAGNLVRRALQKASLNRNLKHFHPGMLNTHVDSVLYKSGMGSALEEINPIDILDLNSKVTRLGEGGIPGKESVPDEARAVQPSHFMFIDPVKTPESSSAGVDVRLAAGAMKGSDRKMYSPFIDVRTGKTAMLSPDALADKVVAFPGERRRAAAEGRPVIKAMHKGQTIFVNPKEVDYEASTTTDMFTHTSNLIPLFSAMKGQRLSMGARMLSQAMCLRDPEAQLVQGADMAGKSLSLAAGKHMGAVYAKEGGVVVGVTPDEVKVRTPSGAIETHELYNNLPFNRKSYLHNTPTVQVGQRIGAGELVARSNFTDARGAMALGKNLRVAYLPYRGKTRYSDGTNAAGADEYEAGANYEDAVVISESAAKKMTSEKMYTHSLESTRFAAPSKSKFIALYPSTFNSKQLETIDDNGVVKPGTRVEYGDPLILAAEQRTSKGAGMLHRGGKSAFNDASVVWTHHFPGVVTDVFADDEGTKIATKGMAPCEVGDKLAGLYGNKGVISAIVPDEQMLHGEDGKPMDLVFNPLGVISRVNPAQAYEALLGKIAKKTNRPYVVPAFKDGAELAEFVQRELMANGEKDLEVLHDPVKNRGIPRVITGHSYILKLHHTAESKGSERGLGAYTIEGEPARGLEQGSSNPKRIGEGEMKALLAHGVPNTISDIKLVRGQRNEDYWRAVIQGRPPPSPGVPNAYRKFLTLLQGAGVNLNSRGDSVQLLAMTDKDVDKLSAGEIKSPDTVRWHASFGRGAFNEKSMDPIDGGLFDRGITGGHGGNRWGHISLDEPLPSPVMEEPIRRLLGLTQKEFEETIAGRHSLGAFGTGAAGIKAALGSINIPREIETQKQLAFNKRGATRDLAIKKMKYLTALRDTNVSPADLVVSKVPVIPPVFRPITSTDKFDMVANPNLLYRSLMQANSNFKQIKGVLEGDHVGDARLNLYKAFKAVTGLGDPVSRELVQQNVGGLLSAIKGDSPKNSLLQRKLIGTSVDVAGRAVITPNPSLNIDQIGIPENMAWEIYSPFVVNRLVREMGGLQNVPAVVRMIEDRAPRAREALLREMKDRPVKASRAPVLHKFGIMAFEPVLVKSKTIQLSPPVTPPFGADFDGDTMNIHVTISPQAIREAREKMMPSKNLRSPADFTPLWGLRQEFLDGLYRASTAKSDKPPKIFQSKAAVLAAFNRGELALDDNIVVAGV